jgi:hypothetical protein
LQRSFSIHPLMSILPGMPPAPACKSCSLP